MRRRLFFFALLILVAISSSAQNAGYDFSAIAPSGQSLYYKITGPGTVKVNYPYCIVYDEYNIFFINYYDGDLIRNDYISGNLTIPDMSCTWVPHTLLLKLESMLLRIVQN